MTRPLYIWLIFALCLTVLLAAMGWASFTVLRLDRAQAAAQQRAEFEERVRLALWRMDSVMTPLIVQESSRPYFTYSAFFPASRAYNKMFTELKSDEVLLPSPLLTQPSTNVLLHFQYGPDTQLTSPQVPTGSRRNLAEGSYLSKEQIEQASVRLDQLRNLINPQVLVRSCTIHLSDPNTIELPQLVQQINPPEPPPQGKVAAADAEQSVRNVKELQARAQTFQQAAKGSSDLSPTVARGKVAEGMVKPIWFGDALVLARRVSVDGREYIQGCWLDWPNLRQWLIESVRDLLPGASLQPLRDAANDPQARLLASLPVRLLPGASTGQADAGASPIRAALFMAWACVAVAAVAVGLLLHGAVSLSERRGAFVSAVTHELRTPLTTFKMYSEMLAEGMVPDTEKRRQYLATLCSEANRLSHLVENVLAYARLERGSARRRIEQVTLAELIERVKPRLVQRAAQAGLDLVVDATEPALQTSVHVDVSAVEQILFNLVDNACKYAAAHATEKRIHLEALPDGKCAMLRVRDHGQGIPEAAARKLFQPFSKSAHEAAHSAPGVGLGLALCRRLSRSMGGDLRLDTLVKDGACFVLTLPIPSALRE